MTITITCPNGHLLRLKDKYAGKTGYCPHCQARIKVPDRSFDDEVLAIVGTPQPPVPSTDSIHDEPREESGVSLLGSALLRRKKVCLQCSQTVSFSFTNCPRCGDPLSTSVVYEPEQVAK